MQVPSTLSGPAVEVFTRASDIPSEVWDTLEAHAVNANVLLPALTSLSAEIDGVVIPNQRWLVFYGQDNPAQTVEFILSYTNGCMGAYPIFIFTTHKYSALNSTYLIPRIQFLAEVLHETVPVERVYSVFAPEIIATLFVDIWTNLTGIERHVPDTAKISSCSRRTLSRRQATQNIAISMRPPRMEEIEQVAGLCVEQDQNSSGE
ncbi:hypothetical protein K443DRAFT_683511 [Laccaria amethystina LaAM-08-1]|uniref:Uncharacterized protein n=1 Tax=Laccaria amethystina LaAM-08-1 TaxID=1095629 RepID=A0A0C9XAM3_9AGAR|nr:hypothetical protein K443DRAFT_683511 [Laccaria amethystina LaAM-08-1]